MADKVKFIPEAEHDLEKIFSSDNPYRGITYPPDTDLEEWKRTCCPQDMHLFDETYSPLTDQEREDGFPEHYLHCDACGLMVLIDKIITDEEWTEHMKGSKK